MDDIIDKLSSSDPRFTHLDLRKIYMQSEDLMTIADKLENNTVVIRVSWREKYHYEASLKKQIEDKVKLNNDTFQRHPNDFTLGLLSWHAYSDSKMDASVAFSSDSGVANTDERNKALRNWNVFKVFDKPESGRYYSVAYINKGKKQIVLAHRGTKIKLSDLLKDESPLKTDLEGILGGKTVEQQKEAYDATEKVIEHAKKEGYNVSFTGHSLGAWLAELSLYYAMYNFEFSEGKAVTFDSPGSASTMKSYKPNVRRAGSDPIIENLDITSYLSRPNLVNCSNPHIGKVYRIFPNLPRNEKIEKLRSKLKEKPRAKRFLSVLMGLLSLDGHRMEPIIATFNSKTGKPERFEMVLDWPCFKYQPKTTSSTVGGLKEKIFKSVMPLCANLPGIGWLVYEVFSKTTLFSVLKAFYDLVNGKIEVHQFVKMLECSTFIAEDRGEEGTILLTYEEQFILQYEVHYSTRELKPFKDYYNSKSNDWYLNKLCKFSDKEISRMNIVHALKEELKQLKAQYKIKFEAGTKYICVKSPETEVDTLREKILRLCKTYGELVEMFDDKYAFYPQDRQLAQPGVISSNLPRSSIFFLRRPKVTKEIDRALNEHRVVAISGPSGTGKTTIAVEYGRDLMEKFSGQIVRIIQADSPEKIIEAYKKMIAEVDLEMNFPDQTAPLLHSKIAELEYPVLFIFDNVESYKDAEAYLEEISTIENIQVIITTRLNNLNENVLNIDLNPFTKEEAKSYLQSTIPPSRGNQHIIDHLINNLRGETFMLPSILSDAAACFKQKLLCSVPRNIGDLKNLLNNIGDLKNLLNTSELSWYVLQYAAYLDPDYISLEIFKELLSVDEEELQVAIEKLERKKLANIKKRKDGERGLRLHRSIQDLVKTYADENKHLKSVIDTHNIQLGINKALLSLLKKGVNQNEDLKLFFPHARQFFSVVLSNNSHLIRRQYLMERELRELCDQHNG